MSRFVLIDITNHIARNVIIPLTHKAEFVNPQIDAPWNMSSLMCWISHAARVPNTVPGLKSPVDAL